MIRKVLAWNTIYPFLIIAIFEGWGVFAAWLSISQMKTRNDAFLAGFIAGIVIGILLEVMWVAQLISMISHQLSQSPVFPWDTVTLSLPLQS